MNVGELRKNIAHLPADAEVKIRVWGVKGNHNIVQTDYMQLPNEPLLILVKKDE